MRHLGGVLEEKAEIFQFVHLTFQEFPAVRRVVKQRQEALPGLQSH